MANDPENSGTLLADIGEYALHSLLADLLNEPGEREVGDDCAVIPLDGDDVILVSVDRLAANVEEYNRARLCVAQTLADIICMGGRPEFFLVALTLPKTASVKSVLDLTRALKSELASYGSKLIGGDTKEGKEFHMVGTALGRANRRRLVRRIGAKPGMKLGVTSTAGRPWGWRWANAIINALKLDVDGELARRCLDADHEIRLPQRESHAAICTGAVRAGLDLSDGIGGGLRILHRESKVGFEVYRSALRSLVETDLTPVADALGLPLECFALSPGYNWENLYVIEGDRTAEVEHAVESTGGRFTVIGEVTGGSEIRVGGRLAEPQSLPADVKFAIEYAWEERFDVWREDCAALLW